MGSLQRYPNVARRVSVRAGRNACPTWSNVVEGLNYVPVPQSRLGLVPALPHDVRHAHHSAAFGSALCHARLLPQESPGKTDRRVSVRAGRNACPTWSNVVEELNNVPVPQSRLGLVPAVIRTDAGCPIGTPSHDFLWLRHPDTSCVWAILGGGHRKRFCRVRRAGFIRPNRLAGDHDHLWGALSMNSEIHSGR
ncbi:hypothetical protein Mal4_53790 [Maioricimonas rarisocia]|uniref:Uncharacterized protein n=1 Tax=Maioricimonas rarisocia TaxID=2528026 RepID=A0A517ZEX4_9PLAN|nr:hypothetical protein Mal4_53790 [Maioricimonas rarisocia]